MVPRAPLKMSKVGLIPIVEMDSLTQVHTMLFCYFSSKEGLVRDTYMLILSVLFV
jgi:hypothetical protein